MLARNFLTAHELGLSVDQHSALVAALGALERNEVSHAKSGNPEFGLPPSLPVQFNMEYWFSKNDCGTVCCIGGLADALARQSLFEENLPPELECLFYAEDCPIDMGKITHEQAARALSNYLTTGEPHWDQAVARVRLTKS